jgi:hypothetical protein
MRRRIRLVGAAAVGLATLGAVGAVAQPVTAAAPAAAPAAGPMLRPLAAHVPALRLEPGRASAADQTSSNWSGYVVTPSRPVTAVTMQFVQPAYGSVPPGFAAIWTGIGGDVSQDLLQAGTAVDPPGFGATYYAWIEMLPASEAQIVNCTGDRGCTVRPGDHLSVSIRQLSTRRWIITFVDRGRWTWRLPVAYSSSRSSAEWIVEAPSLGAPLVGSVQTTLDGIGEVPVSGATFTVAGRTRPISAGNPQSIDLLGVEATPSALSGGGSAFNDCSYSVSCPAP